MNQGNNILDDFSLETNEALQDLINFYQKRDSNIQFERIDLILKYDERIADEILDKISNIFGKYFPQNTLEKLQNTAKGLQNQCKCGKQFSQYTGLKKHILNGHLKRQKSIQTPIWMWKAKINKNLGRPPLNENQ